MSTENTTVATATESKRKGRPVVNGSKRQQVLAARAERIASGDQIKRGRPASTTSKRQQKLADRAARIANGEKVGPGRPKKQTETVAA